MKYYVEVFRDEDNTKLLMMVEKQEISVPEERGKTDLIKTVRLTVGLHYSFSTPILSVLNLYLTH